MVTRHGGCIVVNLTVTELLTDLQTVTELHADLQTVVTIFGN